MKTIPYTPITAAEIITLRRALNRVILAWLRAREHTSHTSHTSH